MIFRPPSKIENVKDPIFFAGPCPLTGTKYAESYNWREDMMALLRKEGFTGDFIDPTNPNFDSSDFAKQVRWEWEGLRIASAIVFWIPRSKEHPALTTNIEFGEWFDNLNTFVGFPEDSINNEYIEQRCKMIGKSVYRTMEDMAKAIVKHFNAPKRWFITSDTHFGAERTLELSKRPFRDVDEMDFALISNWNKKVRSKDGVIHLGDFGDFNACTKLNFGEMKFVLGNYETKNGIFKPSDKRISLLPTGSSVTFRGKKYYLTHKPIGKSMR